MYDSLGNILTNIHHPYTSQHECDNFKCQAGEFRCKLIPFCISIQQVCNTVHDCFHGDDEIDCGSFTHIFPNNKIC